MAGVTGSDEKSSGAARKSADANKSGETSNSGETKKSGKMMKIVVGLVVVVCLLAGGFMFTKHSKGAEKHTIVPIVFDLGEFTTNLSDNSEYKYVKTDVTLEFDDKAPAAEAQTNLDVLRDSIITLLNSETSDDIMLNKDQVKKDCLATVNAHLSTGQAVKVYFSDLIMQ